MLTSKELKLKKKTILDTKFKYQESVFLIEWKI